jgi:hypothetical protein
MKLGHRAQALVVELGSEFRLFVDQAVEAVEVSSLEKFGSLLLQSSHLGSNLLCLGLKALTPITQKCLLLAAEVQLLHHALCASLASSTRHGASL